MGLDMVKLGKKVREIREERGVTQLQLAESANTTEQTISAIEQGKGNPYADTICKLAEALKVSTAALLDQHELADSDEDTAFITFYRERSADNRKRIRLISRLVFAENVDGVLNND